jgi:hypothetical protein
MKIRSGEIKVKDLDNLFLDEETGEYFLIDFETNIASIISENSIKYEFSEENIYVSKISK